MKIYAYIFAFFATLTFVMPQEAKAAVAIEIIDQDSQPSVSASGNTLHVVGANGQMLYIYNAVGVCIRTIKVDGFERSYELNLTKGCYLVKVGKVVRKIHIG